MIRVLLYLIISSFFINVYKRFPLPFSFVSGTANIYLTPKFYAVDILLILLFLAVLALVWRSLNRARFLYFLPLIAFLMGAALSTISSSNLFLSLYSLLRLASGAALFLAAVYILKDSREIRRVGLTLTLSVLVVSLLALVQWRYQHYFLGFLPLGEPAFSATFANSPLVNFFGVKYLRAFGTFSHPNVLGGFLAVSLVISLDTFFKSFRESRRSRASLYLFGVLLFGFLALFLSFSQGAWGAFILAVALYLLLIFLKRPGRLFYFSLIFLVLFFFLAAIYHLPFESDSPRRGELAREAINLWRSRPLFGVGLGNFVAASDYFWKEPVHNIYLLQLAETGLVGLAGFLIFLAFCLKKALAKAATFPLPLVLLIGVLFLGFLDHYLLTSSAGSLLFWLVLGMAASR